MLSILGWVVAALCVLLTSCTPAPPTPPQATLPTEVPQFTTPVPDPALEPQQPLPAESDGAAVGAATGETSFDVVAMVNDKPITEREVRIVAYNVLALRNLTAGTPEWFDEYRRIRRNLLSSLMRLHLISEEALAANVIIDEAQVDEAVRRVRANFPSEDEFQRALAKDRLTLEDLRNAYRKETIVETYKRQRFSPDQFEATEEEARQLYKERAPLFEHPRRVGVQHLSLLVPPDATPETVAMIRNTAQELRNGFEQAARNNQTIDVVGVSNELTEKGILTVANEGYVSLRPTDMDPVSVAMRKQRLFEVSPVIEMRIPAAGQVFDAFHIVQVRSHKQSYESARDEILLTIRTEKAAKAMEAWIEQLYQNADIRIVDSRFRP